MGNMQPPPLMNPPPQIFGAYDHDGMPMGASLAGMDTGGLFGDGMGGGMDESSEAKRRRIARVCALHHHQHLMQGDAPDGRNGKKTAADSASRRWMGGRKRDDHVG